MDVILLERVEKLGALGDTVKVKDGYARNYLLPTGRALRANAANREKFEADRAAIEAKNAERREAASTDSEKLDGQSYIVIRQAGESGQLYGSVSTRDIAAAASENGIAVDRNQVLLEAPIKTIGLYTVRVALHPEVSVEVTVNVARTEDEAEAQARGEDLTGSQSDREEARMAAEELFAEEEADGEDDNAEAEAAGDTEEEGPQEATEK
ncbi:MAG: 50S ribosomal protein L9 [Rhizobiales bacterium]|nr:50S ribosomal protein L9 [Hyphomicrobiales bacterium]